PGIRTTADRSCGDLLLPVHYFPLSDHTRGRLVWRVVGDSTVSDGKSAIPSRSDGFDEELSSAHPIPLTRYEIPVRPGRALRLGGGGAADRHAGATWNNAHDRPNPCDDARGVELRAGDDLLGSGLRRQ